MLDLWIMRHAEAADPDEASSDSARALTERGRRQVGEFARWLKGRVAVPELVWHSPLLRARQTAEIMARELGISTHVTEMSVLSPGMSAERLLPQLTATAATPVLCVGHQPDIGRCLSTLLGGGHFDVAPGFCAAVSFAKSLHAGRASLKWAADPGWFSG